MIAVALGYIACTILVVPCITLLGLLFKPFLKFRIVNLVFAILTIDLAAITAMTIPSFLLLDIVTIVRGIFGQTESYEWAGIGLFTLGAVIATADVLFFVNGFEPGKRPESHGSLARDVADFTEGALDTATDFADGDGGHGDDGGGGH